MNFERDTLDKGQNILLRTDWTDVSFEFFLITRTFYNYITVQMTTMAVMPHDECKQNKLVNKTNPWTATQSTEKINQGIYH